MKSMRVALCLMIAACVSVGCRSEKPVRAALPDAGAPSRPPMTLAEIQRQMAGMEHVSIVEWHELAHFLPDAIGDFKAVGAVTGDTRGMGAIKLSRARRTYRHRSTTVQLSVLDTAFDRGLADGFRVGRLDKAEEGASGYRRPIDIAGQPALAAWQRGTRAGDVSVLVGGRFLLDAQATRVPDTKSVTALLAKLDLARLAKLGAR